MDKNKRKTRLTLAIVTILIACLIITAFIMASTYQSRVISIKYSLTYLIHFVGLIVLSIVYLSFTTKRISYLKSFGVLSVLGVIIAIVTGVSIYVYTSFIDPNLLICRQELLLNNSSNTQEINYIKQMLSPIATALSTTVIITILSVVYASLIAIFAHRTKEYKV